MKKHNIQYALLGCLLTLSATAQAAFIEYTTSFTANNFLSNTTTTGYSLSDSGTTLGIANLSRFDSSLGTLTGVDISFTSDWTHSTYASAYDSTAERITHSYTHTYSCGWFSTCSETRYYYTYSNDTYINASSTNNLSLSLIDPSSATNTTVDYNSTVCSSAVSSSSSVSCTANDQSTGVFTGSLDLSTFDLSQFITSDPTIDPLIFNLSNLTSISGTCDNSDPGDTCSARATSSWFGDITVGYTYDDTQVPEPTSLLLLSTGLLGLGVRRKLRQKRRAA